MQKTGKRCDLHTHTVHSDGTYTPRELVSAAQDIGLSAIALTDHNTVSGLCEFVSAAKESGIEYAAGVEFSTEYEDKELHIIGMFVRPEHYSEIESFIGNLKEKKNEANRALVARLLPLGYEIDYDALLASTPDGYVNRAHIAVEMIRRGYVKSFGEAFDGVLSESAGYYVPPRRRGAFETIDFIKSIGAVSVLAHPLLQLSHSELEVFLSEAVKHGLCAIETQYVRYTEEEREFSSKIARSFSLLESGGSDFHGDNKPYQRLGVGKGDLFVPYEFYERLKEKSQEL